MQRNKKVIIFNGLSERRYELTKYLNSKKDKSIILVECESEKYDEEFSLDIDINKHKEINLEIEKKIMNDCDIKLRKNYDGLYEIMDKVCLSCAAVIFKNKVFSNPQEKYDISGLMKKLNVRDEFRPFFVRLLTILEEQGYLTSNNDNITVLKSIEDIPEAQNVLSEFIDEQKKFIPYAELLIYCASKYERVFKGEIPANEVIYPTGEFNMLENVDNKLPIASKRPMYGEVLAEIINNFIRQKKKKVRVLEIGAGTGALTYKIIPRIKDIDDMQYCFTDIGQSFVAKAKIDAEINGYNFMDFRKLDISKDIKKQGFYENSFDIIISYDVIQATDSIEVSLNNVRKMLVSGGIFAQIQSYEDHHIDNLIYGLSPGWWNFAKDPIRGNRITMLPVKWQEVLEDVGFKDVQILPEKVELSDAAVILSYKQCQKCMDSSPIIYDKLKNNWLKKLKSVNKECNVEFIKSFRKEEIDIYLDKFNLDENTEVLYRDNPEDIDENKYLYDLNASDLKLLEILRTVFGVKNISIDDDLEKLGLDSLSGLILISKIREAFDVELNMKNFYSFKSVFDISQYLKNIDIKKIKVENEEENKKESEIGNKSLDDLLGLL